MKNTCPIELSLSPPCFSKNIICAALALIACTSACSSERSTKEIGNSNTWKVYALEYGTSERFSRSALIHGAPKDQRVPLSWYAWLISRGGKNARNILVDTGFDDEARARSWRFTRITPPRELLNKLGINASLITDVVLTHAHWDHIGDVSSYDKAAVWMQRKEFEWASGLVSEKRPSRGGVLLRDVAALKLAQDRGKLKLIDGDREIAPGVILHLGGNHTSAIQWIEARTGGAAGTVVLATDIAYLYENIEENKPSGSTSDKSQDLVEMKRMRNAASRLDLVIPGHDPLVAKRFNAVKTHIYRIE